MTARSVLVHAPNWVGDHALAFPFYAALRELLPKAKIVLIGRAWIADLTPDKFGGIIAFRGKEPASEDLKRLRAEEFDVAFTLSPSFRSALLLWRIRAKRRYGFASDLRRLLLTTEKNKLRRQPYNRHEHRAMAYLRLLNPLLPAGTIAEDLWENTATQNFPLCLLRLLRINSDLIEKRSASLSVPAALPNQKNIQSATGHAWWRK